MQTIFQIQSRTFMRNYLLQYCILYIRGTLYIVRTKQQHEIYLYNYDHLCSEHDNSC
jgi:hypothetical protein